MKKRLFATVLALCLLVLLLPAAAVAAVTDEAPAATITALPTIPSETVNETPFLTERLEVTVSETGALRDALEATDVYVQERVTELVISTENGCTRSQSVTFLYRAVITE